MPSTPIKISNQRLVKQYLRWIPAQLGLINKTAFLLQINNILPDDVFVVSYPKSGNTWLRFIIAYLRQGVNTELSFDEVENAVFDVYISKDKIDRKKANRFIKTHDTYFDDYPKSIYIYRDYREVLVSLYFYKISLKEYQGDFSSFIRSNEVSEAFGTWQAHVQKALDFSSKKPNRILMLKYENLQIQFEQTVIDISEFCNLQISDIASLKMRTSFPEMRRTEDKFGSEFKKLSGKNFFREGKTSTWRAYFSDHDLEYLYSNKQLVDLFTRLDYKMQLNESSY